MTDRREEQISRREFLARAGKAGAAIGVAGAIGYGLYDSTGPARRSQVPARQGLPDFSLPDQAGRIAIATGEERQRTLQAAVEALGGMGRFVSPGDRVVVKVNAAFASPPTLSATAHPEVVGEIVRLSLQGGADSVVVTDNPINDPRSCFGLTGIGRAAEEAGGEVRLPKPRFFETTTLPGGRLIRNWPVLTGPLAGANKLIGVAPVKDHHRSGASLTMKNWYGLLGGRRSIFHQDIHNIIKELAMMVRPTLVVLDGTVTMMRNGPTGGSLADLEPTNTMIVSTDQVAADAVGAELLGRRLDELPFISKAQRQGLGVADYESLNPVRVEAA